MASWTVPVSLASSAGVHCETGPLGVFVPAECAGFHVTLFFKQVRIILNKSDQVDQQQLMRVYGALMWSLGKVFKSPEVCKVRRGGGANSIQHQ